MKTTFTNRKEKACNYLSKQTGMIGLLMVSALMTSSIASAQRVVNSNDVNSINTGISDPLQKNPITTNPVKNIVTVVPAIPLCPTLSTFEMIDKSYNKVILGWNNTVNFDSITIRYCLSGTGVYRTEKMAGTPNPGFYILEGLASQTTYDFEISTKCHTGATSNWTAPLTITTFAEPAPRLSSNQRNTNMLRINPNPATTITTISFVAPVNTSHLIIITSSAGREVLKTTAMCTVGKLQFPVDVSNMVPGLYFVRVYSGTSMSVERLIVQ